MHEAIDKLLVRPEHILVDGNYFKHYSDKDGNYSYLINMPIYTFTEERITDLKKQEENKLCQAILMASVFQQ